MLNPALAIIVIDCLVPESVPVLLDFIAEMDEETLTAGLACWAYEAERELNQC